MKWCTRGSCIIPHDKSLGYVPRYLSCICLCHWYDDPIYAQQGVKVVETNPKTCFFCSHIPHLGSCSNTSCKCYAKGESTDQVGIGSDVADKPSFLRGQKFNESYEKPGIGQVLSRNPTFNNLLDELKELHDKKSHDYAQDANVYSNFELAADIAGVTVNQVFRVLIGVKLARLKELLSGPTKPPNNESIMDTFKDLTVYSGLMTSYAKDREAVTPSEIGYKEGL